MIDIIKEKRIIDFDQTDQTSLNYLKHFNLLEFKRHERHFVNNNPALIQMIEQELCYGVLTIEMALKYLDSNNLIILNSGKFLENTLTLAWYPRHQTSEYFKDIIKSIK